MNLLLFCFAVFGASYADFTSQGNTAMLNGHNAFRSKIALGKLTANGKKQPPATDMTKLKWSKNLASAAQEYAATCPDGPSGSEDFGENFYVTNTEDYLYVYDKFGLEAMQAWQQEFDQIGLSSLVIDQDFLDSGPKSASLMAWSSSTSMGCGVTDCGPDPNRFDDANKVVVVCRYAETGNQLGQPIYEAGKTCSNCQNFLSCDKPSGLCTG